MHTARVLPIAWGYRYNILPTVVNAGCTFDIVVHTSDRGVLPVQFWAEDLDEDSASAQTVILPLKTASLPGAVNLQLYVES